MAYFQINSFMNKFLDENGLQEVLQRAIAEALNEHKLAGNQVPIWHEGQVVYVEPELS